MSVTSKAALNQGNGVATEQAATAGDELVVAVVGLGYVGLPLAVAFGRKVRTIGFDVSTAKIAAYRKHLDPTGEVSADEIRGALHLEVTADPALLKQATAIIVAVPTPVDAAHQPDFGPLISASITVGANLQPGVVVIYESTVYPGATEEVCVPVLEKHSKLKWRTDFHVGYSPERINPGDREHTLTKIIKVVAGDDAATLDRVAALYASVIDAGVHRAASIKVAEAAKVIENTQRDLNVALMNELAIIFDRLGIDTLDVLKAAGTKWNFLPFRPGLVGGHCIGVDPYYLTHKAETVGYHPEVILAGRRINDGMGKFIAEKTVKLMIAAGVSLKGAKVNVLGLAFKENCPDLRNSRVPDIIAELRSYGLEVNAHDPAASAEEARHEYGIELRSWDELPQAEAIVIAVAHREYVRLEAPDYRAKLNGAGVVVDVKSALAPLIASGLPNYWRL